jgi:hypothetical protein
MKKLHAVIVLAAASVLAGSAWADDASRMAKAEELLQVTKTEQNFKQMLDRIQTMMKTRADKQSPEGADKAAIAQKVAAIVDERLSWDKLKPQFVKMYADTFTDEDLDGILAFYKSAAGQAMATKTPELMDKAVRIAQAAMQDAQPDIRKALESPAPAKEEAK